MLSSSQDFLKPEQIITNLNIEAGDHVADFGAGHGYFTLPIAKIVGGDGKVYAIDIQKSVLEVIRAKAKLEHLLNIEPIWGNLEEIGGSKLKEKFIDLVMVNNIFFQVEDKFTLLREAHRILREDGSLALIEWNMSVNSLGPPISLRIPQDNVKSMVVETGFAFVREIPAGSHHFGLLFVKK
ncbi:MAG: class I SAM-dependent methyltransferase [Candidatus Portnoybacteria bacterium]|nr:class I SAM-dependent methyltransferase [Candidatus Portnoybacteria bacterium]